MLIAVPSNFLTMMDGIVGFAFVESSVVVAFVNVANEKNADSNSNLNMITNKQSLCQINNLNFC